MDEPDKSAAQWLLNELRKAGITGVEIHIEDKANAHNVNCHCRALMAMGTEGRYVVVERHGHKYTRFGTPAVLAVLVETFR